MKNLNLKILFNFKIASLIFFLSVSSVFSQSNGLQLGYDYINAGNYYDAIRIFEQHLISDPADMTARMQLAYLYKNEGRNSEAIREFEMVSLNSIDNEQVRNAKKEMELISGIGLSKTTTTTNELDEAYTLLSNKRTDEALAKFVNYYYSNPNDTKVAMQIGYIYKQKNDLNNALRYFEIVEKQSYLTSEVNDAQTEITNIKNILYPPVQTYTPVSTTTVTSSKLDLAYGELNAGNKSGAIRLFEDYLIENPSDMSVRMQLGYLYSEMNNTSKAREYFSLVAQNSFDQKQRDDARTAFNNLTVSRTVSSSRGAVEIYFYNIYDTFQENYISNFLGKYSYNFAPRQTFGIYADLYVDSKSKPEAILNDRYIETGIYYRYAFAPQLSFEVRGGYVNLIDKKETRFNLKPILTFSNRFGNVRDFLPSGTPNTTGLYIDAYAAALYDLKYENFFGQVTLREVARFMTGGYSNFEMYLKQSIFKDSQNLNYNNYAEVGGGISFKPNLKEFPVLFIEATNKIYFDETFDESFQIKAGFLLNLYSIL